MTGRMTGKGFPPPGRLAFREHTKIYGYLSYYNQLKDISDRSIISLVG